LLMVDGLLFAGFRLRQSDSQLKPPPPSISRLNPPVHQFRLYLCWCARTIVESIRMCSISVSPAKAFATRVHTPLLRQREKRIYTVCHRPNSAGRSRHGLPVRAIHSTASRNQRLLDAVRPRSPSLPGRITWTLFHTSSLSNVRTILSRSAKDKM
jgi:hypothetical protein